MFGSTKRAFPLLSFALGAAVLVAAAPEGANAGCFVPGYGGTVLDSECTYEETDEGANVYVAAQANWTVVSIRSCPLLTDQCRDDAEGCTEPCHAALEDDRCTPAPENQCKQATTASGVPRFFEREVLVAEGGTLPLPQPIHAATKPGDFVIVRMVADDAGQGPWGFISVGQDDDF